MLVNWLLTLTRWRVKPLAQAGGRKARPPKAVTAAINILAAGLVATACGGNPVTSPAKQEPARTAA